MIHLPVHVPWLVLREEVGVLSRFFTSTTCCNIPTLFLSSSSSNYTDLFSHFRSSSSIRCNTDFPSIPSTIATNIPTYFSHFLLIDVSAHDIPAALNPASQERGWTSLSVFNISDTALGQSRCLSWPDLFCGTRRLHISPPSRTCCGRCHPTTRGMI